METGREMLCTGRAKERTRDQGVETMKDRSTAGRESKSTVTDLNCDRCVLHVCVCVCRHSRLLFMCPKSLFFLRIEWEADSKSVIKPIKR